MAVLVWLPRRRVPDEKEKIFHLEDPLFSEGTSRSFFQGLLGSGVNNETVPSDGYSPEGMLSKFRGAAR